MGVGTFISSVSISDEARKRVENLTKLVDSCFADTTSTDAVKNGLHNGALRVPDASVRKLGTCTEEYLTRRLACSGWSIEGVKRRWKSSRQNKEALEILSELTLLEMWEVRALLGLGDSAIEDSDVNMAAFWCGVQYSDKTLPVDSKDGEDW